MKERRTLEDARREGQLRTEIKEINKLLFPTLDGVGKILFEHGIEASISSESPSGRGAPEHPEITFSCSGPQRRNGRGDLSSPKSAIAIFHYDSHRLILEVTDYSFSTIRHSLYPSEGENKIDEGVKHVIESYYQSLNRLTLAGFSLCN